MYFGKDINENLMTDKVILSVAQGYTLSSSVIPSSKILNNWNVIDTDIYNSFNASTGIYTIPKDGIYFLQFSLSSSTSYVWDFYFRKDTIRISGACGLGAVNLWSTIHCCTLYEFNAGETFHLYHSYHTGSNNYLFYEMTAMRI